MLIFNAQKNWRPAFAGRQNQTQGVEARYAFGTALSGRQKAGRFAPAVMAKTVRHPKSSFPGLRDVRMVSF